MRIGIGLGACLTVGFLFGCGTEQKDPYAGMTQEQRLTTAAQKIDNDPAASVAAKRVADGALQQLQSQQQLNSFENGK